MALNPDLHRLTIALAYAALVLSACVSPAPDSPAPPASATAGSMALATPVSQEPAAGICAAYEESVIVLTIHPDIPDPRCAVVMAGQRLRVLNQTTGSVHVSIGPFQFDISAGGDYAIDMPFGAYLAPGVHVLNVQPCCGPELWLKPPGE